MFRKVVPILSIITILLLWPILPTQSQGRLEEAILAETPEAALPVLNPPRQASAVTATATKPPTGTPPIEVWPPTLIYPINNLMIGKRRPVFDWSDVPGVYTYYIQVSKSKDFSTLLIDATVYGSSFRPPKPLPRYVMLYWRVRSHGYIKPSEWSAARFRIRKITRTFPVTVTVKDIYGVRKAGVSVSAFIGSTYTGYRKVTNSNGQAIFSLPYGRYRFRVGYYDKTFWSGNHSHCFVPGCQAVIVIVGPEPTSTPTYKYTPTPTPT